MDSKTTIASLRKKVISFRNARNWKKYHTPKDVAIGLINESSEVLEHFRFKNEQEVKLMLLDAKKKRELKHELADVLYALLLLSHEVGVDLSEAFEEKLKITAIKYPVKLCKGKNLKHSEYRRKK